jgi:hypothetical protein
LNDPGKSRHFVYAIYRTFRDLCTYQYDYIVAQTLQLNAAYPNQNGDPVQQHPVFPACWIRHDIFPRLLVG